MYPSLWSFWFKRCSTTTEPSNPALSTILLQGACTAFLIILSPCYWSKFSIWIFSRTQEAYNNATPPPMTTPSSKAHLVAYMASFSLSLTSLTSTSVAPPTLMTPTPPDNLAYLSWSFSFSYSEVVDSISALIL